jgi:hypothetical protein
MKDMINGPWNLNPEQPRHAREAGLILNDRQSSFHHFRRPARGGPQLNTISRADPAEPPCSTLAGTDGYAHWGPHLAVEKSFTQGWIAPTLEARRVRFQGWTLIWKLGGAMSISG